MAVKKVKQPQLIKPLNCKDISKEKEEQAADTPAPNSLSVTPEIIKRAKINPSNLTSSNILALQATIGNKAVQRLLVNRNRVSHKKASDNFRQSGKATNHLNPEQPKITSSSEISTSRKISQVQSIAIPSIQRMPLESFREKIKQAASDDLAKSRNNPTLLDERNWVEDFMDWMRMEYEEMERSGAFIQGGRMYNGLGQYIEDSQFDTPLLNSYLEQYHEMKSNKANNKHLDQMLSMKDDNDGQEKFKWAGFSLPQIKNSSQQQQKPFYRWVTGNATAPEPTQMNCWEAVLYAASKAGIINKAYIIKALKFVGADFAPGKLPKFVVVLRSNPARSIPQGNNAVAIVPRATSIPAGYVVVFGETAQHVALSTGKTVPISSQDMQQRLGHSDGHGVVELDSSTTGVVESNIEDIEAKMGPYATRISWGPLPPFSSL